MEDYYDELLETEGSMNDPSSIERDGGDGGGASDSSSFSTSSMFLLNLTSMNTSNGSYYDNYTNFSRAGWDNESNGLDLDGELPVELTTMSESSKHCMIAYCILFVIGTSGNLTVLLSVFNQYKKTKSRISLLILHLSIADLIVCCTLIPTEVFWRMTIQWRGGNELCKIMQFLQAFGLYLSSMVLICVSLDRFFAILFPMKMLKRQGHQRIKIMLWIAWIASATFSAPQAILFSVVSHPMYPSFKQCRTPDENAVRINSIFSVSAMYFAPLVVIIFTYTSILFKIIRKSHQNQPFQLEEEQQQPTTTRNRHSIRFRMSIRGMSGNQRNSAVSNANNCNNSVKSANSVCNNVQQSVKNAQNHSKLCVMTGSQGRRNPHNSTSDHTELSSEEGSCSGSTCSTMNTSSVNTSTIGAAGGGNIKFPPPQHHHPTSPEIVILDRVNSHRTQLVLRRSENAVGQMSRAKNRSLVMTISVMVAFICSWTGYVMMTLWYMIDWEGAKGVDPRVQDGLFVMAVANSCVNPLIYGSFAKNCCGLSKIFGRLRHVRGQ